MKLIVGLGNPGKKYTNTRHNLGFKIIDEYARSHGRHWQENLDLIGHVIIDEDFVLLKSNTFMNRSGDSVRQAAGYFEVKEEDILVIYDDMDLGFGRIHLAFGGSSAGHRGVASVIEGLGYAEFSRLRIGIGKPFKGDSEDYVLHGFTSEQKKQLKPVLLRCMEAIDSYLDGGIDATMNKFN